jgi:hypothetical protein
MGFNSGFKGLMQLKLSLHFLEEHSNIKFYENSSSGGQVVQYGLKNRRSGRQAGRRTDILKLIVALHNFEHATKSNDV